MQNDERKYAILYSIIKDYIKTAEPVGSRTIEKKYNLGISSATIRNEMADLEEMGFLIQPHTSSGRIPSDKAYRLYVDEYMQVQGIDKNIATNVRREYQKYLGELNRAIEKTAEILTKLTNYTSLVMAPSITELNVKDIRVIHIENERVLLVVITKQGIVKNTEIKLREKVSYEQVEKINNFLVLFIKGLKDEFLFDKFHEEMRSLDMYEQKILSEIVPAIKYALKVDNDAKIYSQGVTNILDYPEFQDIIKAKRYLEALDRKDILSSLMYEALDGGMSIKIGDENNISELRDCSILTATYKLNGQAIGSIGLVGPKRMDYDHCVSTIQVLTQELTNHINNTLEKEK